MSFFRIPWHGAVRLFSRAEYETYNPLYKACLGHVLRMRLGTPWSHADLADIELEQLTTADFTEATAAYERAIQGKPNTHKLPGWPKDVLVPRRACA